MKNRVALVFLACLLFAAAASGTAARPQAPSAGLERISLDGAWEFKNVKESVWRPAVVPGCVHTDLLAAGLIPDPFVGDNELRVQWVDKEDWEYRKAFDAPPALLARERVELVAEGLDTYARLFLNGRSLAETNNQFRTWRFDVKPFLVAASNELRIVFDSSVRRENELKARLPYRLPGEAPHSRKSPYHFGWDWGPRLTTSGVWRPIRLEAWDRARIEDIQILQEPEPKGAVGLRVRVQVQSEDAQDLSLNVAVFGPRNAKLERRLAVRAARDSARHEVRLTIKTPDRWWPNGLGGQPLYTVEAALVRGGERLDAASRRIGIRTVTLEQKPDEWGKSFYFAVNGVPVFAKGGNWIPADSFADRVTPEKYRALLESCRDANMNMIRVWGGGYYERPEFYDLCDELGLLVWQDFMFACALYPGDAAFLDNVRLEAEDVVRELRHHPSLALWCGNNECEEGWFHWGWKETLPASVFEDYLKIFDGILPEAVAALDPGRPYWPSSPHSTQTGDPRSERSGDMHVWTVWHGMEPFVEYTGKGHRFMSEFGFQSFPLLETVKTYARPEDWNLTSPVMELHQKHPRGNKLILYYMLDHYRLPKDFSSLLWLSQVLQAEGMKTAVEHWRSVMPRTMGALYWQLDDCWPVASWSGMDYYGRWKALQFYAKRFFAPLIAVPRLAGDRLEVRVVSDLGAEAEADLVWQAGTYDGKILASGREPVRAKPRTTAFVWSRPAAELKGGLADAEVHFACRLVRGGTVLHANTLHFSELKQVRLPKPEIRVEIRPEDGQFLIRLESKAFAKNVHLAADGVPGAFSDNFFDLAPGWPTEVVFRPEAKTDGKVFQDAMKIRSLRDSYD
ncbi:MAG: glycoside hydrolase family 2 protein [Candidatus Aminicenantes bacterium]|nr:glycoside hydrolase family 2 protein [Candidatus Aminicenantes bacterium]